MTEFFESLINLIKFQKIDKKSREFVFFSESMFYREHFLELILHLKKKNKQNLIFVSSDKSDIFFFRNLTKCFYIKNRFILIIFFKILHCKFLIMTLTGLGNPLPKSSNCKCYVCGCRW